MPPGWNDGKFTGSAGSSNLMDDSIHLITCGSTQSWAKGESPVKEVRTGLDSTTQPRAFVKYTPVGSSNLCVGVEGSPRRRIVAISAEVVSHQVLGGCRLKIVPIERGGMRKDAAELRS